MMRTCHTRSLLGIAVLFLCLPGTALAAAMPQYSAALIWEPVYYEIGSPFSFVSIDNDPKETVEEIGEYTFSTYRNTNCTVELLKSNLNSGVGITMYGCHATDGICTYGDNDESVVQTKYDSYTDGKYDGYALVMTGNGSSWWAIKVPATACEAWSNHPNISPQGLFLDYECDRPDGDKMLQSANADVAFYYDETPNLSGASDDYEGILNRMEGDTGSGAYIKAYDAFNNYSDPTSPTIEMDYAWGSVTGNKDMTLFPWVSGTSPGNGATYVGTAVTINGQRKIKVQVNAVLNTYIKAPSTTAGMYSASGKLTVSNGSWQTGLSDPNPHYHVTGSGKCNCIGGWVIASPNTTVTVTVSGDVQADIPGWDPKVNGNKQDSTGDSYSWSFTTRD